MQACKAMPVSICFCPLVPKIVFYKKLITMNRLLLPALALVLLMNSCQSSGTKSTEKKNEKDTAIAGNSASQAVNLIGSYVGPFGDNKITLLITRISNDTIEGRSVVGGNDRPYSGTIKLLDNKYDIVAKEPGDDKYDGVFHFSIDPARPDEVSGGWVPNNPGAHLGPKDFTLKRRSFQYLVDVGVYPQGSKRLLTEDDVNNLMKDELELMRNEIFARHGYCFRRKNLREQFEDKDWYIPNTVDVRNSLTEIEKKNIVLIKRYEKYADEYGDEYGR